jgi:hypothetical protein
METATRDLRQRLRRAGAAGKRVRYPVDLRREVVVLARQAIADGSSQSGIALELGLSQPTLGRWLAGEPQSLLRPVEVASSLGSEGGTFSGLRLKTPRGYVIEGLDLQTVAALLRVLG